MNIFECCVAGSIILFRNRVETTKGEDEREVF